MMQIITQLMTMKLILGDKPIEFLMPYAVTRQAIDQWKEDMRNKKDNDTKISNAIAIVQNTDWYKTLGQIEKDIINKKNIKELLKNGVKNEQIKPVNMKIESDRILELIKIVLLAVIVILLWLNFYSGGSESKYEIYGNGMFRLNKETGDTYQPKEMNGTVEYVKIKIKE
jgi:hypothetical protein